MKYRTIGNLKHNPQIRTRDGGLSAKLDNRVFWLFGDTILVDQPEDKLPELSCTVGWSNPSSPLIVNDLESGLQQFIPFSGADIKNSTKAWQESGSRLAIWPMSLVAHDNKAIGLFRKLWINEGFLNYQYISTILASFDGQNLIVDNEVLFLESEGGLYGDASIIDNNYLYLFGCRHNNVFLARTIIGESKYQFWSGTQWQEKHSKNNSIFSGPSSDFSVIKWNEKFLAIYSQPMANSIQILACDSLISPWKIFGEINLEKPTFGNCYAAQAHPELSEGNKLQISYYRPKTILDGSLEMIEITI